jgi:hypothetical protein
LVRFDHAEREAVIGNYEVMVHLFFARLLRNFRGGRYQTKEMRVGLYIISFPTLLNREGTEMVLLSANKIASLTNSPLPRLLVIAR